MKRKQFSRRGFIVTTSAALLAGCANGVLRRPASAERTRLCQEIDYPSKGSVMFDMQDIGDIGTVDALILAHGALRAQNAFAAQEVLNEVRMLGSLSDSNASLLEQALRSATLAWNETQGEPLSREWIAAALCLNIGHVMAPQNPNEFSAAVLRPYLDESVYEIVRAYPQFDSSEKFRTRPWYQLGLRFCDWQRRAMNSDMTPYPIEKFEPVIKALFHATLLDHPSNERIIPSTEAEELIAKLPPHMRAVD